MPEITRTEYRVVGIDHEQDGPATEELYPPRASIEEFPDLMAVEDYEPPFDEIRIESRHVTTTPWVAVPGLSVSPSGREQS